MYYILSPTSPPVVWRGAKCALSSITKHHRRSLLPTNAQVLTVDPAETQLIITVAIVAVSVALNTAQVGVTRMTDTLPEDVIVAVLTHTIVVAIFVLTAAPINDVFTLSAVVAVVTTRALPPIVISGVRARTVSGAVLAFSCAPIAYQLTLVTIVTAVTTCALPVIVVVGV